MIYPFKKLVIFLFAIGLYYSGISQVIYVKENGTGNGTSWADASGNLKTALDNATFGTQIWVAEGIYAPTNCNPCIFEDREIYFQVKDGVKLYGGFDGNETTLNERDVENNLTFLSGNIDEDDTPWSNSFTILYTQDVSEETIIDGFIIEDGNADFGNSAAGNPMKAGGGLYNTGATSGHFSNLTVRNCIFRNNLAKGFGGAVFNDGAFTGSCLGLFENCTFENNIGELGGGGMYNNGIFDGVCSPTITNCTFSNNDATFGNGGGISNQGAENGLSNSVFTNCTFEGNTSSIDGGAVYNFGKTGTTNPSFSNCSFSNNASHDGGAIYNDGTFNGEANPIFDDCNFTGNVCTNGNGGAIYNSGIENGLSSPVFTNCHFHQNESSAAAGAVFNNGNGGDSSPDFINCIFSENLANEIAGAVYNLGKAGNSSPLFMNCLIYRNTAFVSAAGIYNLGSEFGNASPAITNCTFYGNTAPISGAVYNNASNENGTSNTIITNCIFWGNNADLGKVLRNIWSTPTISNSIVDVADCDELNSTSGNAVLNCGNGLLFNEYPEFADTMNNNFRLLIESPGIDVGDNSATNMTGVLVDLDSFPRIVENVVDFGAFEFGANVSMAPIITQSPENQTVCEGESVTFSVSASSASELFYQWQKDENDILGATSNTYAIPSASSGDEGMYRCIVSNDFDEETISESAELVVNNSGIVTATIDVSSTAICEGDEVTISAIIENGGSFPFFQWSINGNPFGASIQSFTINSLSDGDEISLTFTSNADCVNNPVVEAGPVAFSVGGFISAAVFIESNVDDICEGEEVTFTATPTNGGDAPEFQWFINEMSQSTTSNIFITTDLQEGDEVQCQLTSTSECVTDTVVLSNIESIIVNEFVDAEIPITNFEDEICIGEEVFFFAEPLNEGTAPAFEWFVNGVPQGINSIDFLATDLPDDAEVFIRLISSKDCIIEDTVYSQTILMNVMENVLAAVEIEASIDTTICVGDDLTFTATTQNGGDAPLFSWAINGMVQSETSNVFSTTTLADGDLVQCEFATSLMCASPLPALSNMIEVSVDSCDTAVRERLSDADWSVYPNPIFDHIKITTNGYFSDLKVEIVNMTGGILVETIAERFDNAEIILNLVDLPAGLYIIKISDEQTFGIKKFIKK